MKRKGICIISAAAVLIAAALIFLYAEYITEPDRKLDKEYNLQMDEYESLDSVVSKNTGDVQNKNYLAECQDINPQTVAWIYIPDTKINFPVVQSEDNEYYLSHNFDGEDSVLGVPFLDYRCDSDFSGFQSIIYGHHIKGNRMFSGLVSFQDKEYFEAHDIMYLTTENEKYTIDIIACMVVKSDSFVYNTVFLTDDEKNNFIDTIRQEAVCLRDFEDFDIDNNRLITLSTCSYEFEDARTVIIGYLQF